MTGPSSARLNVMLTAVAVVTFAILVLSVIAFPLLLDTDRNADAIARGNDITACRAQANAQVTDARAVLDEARSGLDLLTAQIFELALLEDEDGLALVGQALPAARTLVKDASERLQAENDTYLEAVELSSTDPDRFLDECDP